MAGLDAGMAAWVSLKVTVPRRQGVTGCSSQHSTFEVNKKHMHTKHVSQEQVQIKGHQTGQTGCLWGAHGRDG